jgi:isoleucyl-tRNA synthetase
MSKSKGNTVDPVGLFDRYGADATRWYLLYASPAWSPTRFDEEGLKELSGKFFGTLRNVYHFFALYSNQDGMDPRTFGARAGERPELDRWILSKYNRLISEVTGELERYDHMKAVRGIQYFVIEDLSNWFIRRARRRFWAERADGDKQSVYEVTWEVLKGVAQLLAPFAPFLSDEIYRNLTGGDSVHLSLYPTPDRGLIDGALEERMDLFRDLAALGRGAREKERIKVRQPLAKILVDGKYEALIGDMTALLTEELNVREVVFENDLGKYMNFSLKPNFRTAGPALGAKMKSFAAALAKADAASLHAVVSEKGFAELTVEGENLRVEGDFLEVRISAKDGFTVAMENNLFTILDTGITPELMAEGIARELVSKIQQIRKQMDFDLMDRIRVSYEGDEAVRGAVAAHREYIMKETLALLLDEGDSGSRFDLNGHDTAIDVSRA